MREIRLMHGDCLAKMKNLPDNSVDSIVTDPPYGISFMGKKWDYQIPSVEVWTEAMRVLKPGGHMLCACGTRTQHRMVCNIEDAGFEIRDVVSWIYGSGFPKSLSISKQLDKQEQNKWKKIEKALDFRAECGILEAWKNYSNNVNSAGLQFVKRKTATGTATPKNDSALVNVMLSTKAEKSNVSAIIAELCSCDPRHMSTQKETTARLNAEVMQTPLSNSATSAEKPSVGQKAKQSEITCTVPINAKEWLSENMAARTKVEEALKIWLGKGKSSSKAATNVLCAALTDGLKGIILNQSKTFQSLDTTRQTECASAINVIIMESTAARLITSTVDTLRNKAIDKAAGAEREVVGKKIFADGTTQRATARAGIYSEQTGQGMETAPATDEAKQWDGWGTALKPACEFFTLARKPLSEKTVAANVLKWGTGGINVDGCRVEIQKGDTGGFRQGTYVHQCDPSSWDVGKNGDWYKKDKHPQGRFPANLIHDGSPEVVDGFPVSNSTRSNGNPNNPKRGMGHTATSYCLADGVDGVDYRDTGSVSRYFYCAKASKKDRGEGNNHPTVKPTELMRYLCRLITPPTGVVLDPFMGSGSTGKAAKLEHFGFIGIERDDKYFEIAKKRIEEANATLF